VLKRISIQKQKNDPKKIEELLVNTRMDRLYSVKRSPLTEMLADFTEASKESVLEALAAPLDTNEISFYIYCN